jgi:hypothetical protein
VVEESSRSNRFRLSADRAAEDERAVREFLRGKGRGVDGSRFRAFVRDCRRRVGPGPVFEPDINMTLDGVLYDWGVWFRPRLNRENVSTTANLVAATMGDDMAEQLEMAVPARPDVDTVMTRDTDHAHRAHDEERDSAVADGVNLSAIQTVIGSSGRPNAAPSPSAQSATAPPPAATPTEKTSGSTRSTRSI